MRRREELIRKTKNIVIKIGSSVLVDSARALNPKIFSRLAGEIADLLKSGRRMTIVSSGAVAGGIEKLSLRKYPAAIDEKQAAAAIGQNYLMNLYEQAFAKYGIKIAQILLTHDDFTNRERYVNAKNTLNKLFEMGVVPVVNENDTVATDEIRIGDNDNLSAQIVGLVNADLLCILSDIEGLYDKDPKKFNDAKFVPLVDTITERWLQAAGKAGNVVSVGGMRTKIEAALSACSMGAAVIITDGRKQESITKIFNGEPIGTLFLPKFGRLTARKFWIAFTLRPSGAVVIDEGARKAIVEQQKSLLPGGVRAVTGSFDRGGAVRILSEKGAEIGRGLTKYSSGEVAKLAGVKTTEINDKIGFKISDEVIHRDDMVILEERVR
ncbi:MAG TPA: glutamate 5-kinase [bacterium]